MKCPICDMAELVKKSETEYGEPMDKPYEIKWIECPNCGADFDTEEDAQNELEDKESELNAKHEECPEPEYEPEMDRDFYVEHDDDIPYDYPEDYD